MKILVLGGTQFFGKRIVQRLADGRPVLIPRSTPTAILRHAYAGDVAEAFVGAVDSQASWGKTYNLAGEEIVSLDDYVRALAEVVGRDSRLVSAPLERIRERPSLAGYAPPFAGERFIMDTGRAKQDLGYQPTPLGRWLPKTVNSLLDANEGEDSKDYGRRQAEVEAAEALGLT